MKIRSFLNKIATIGILFFSISFGEKLSYGSLIDDIWNGKENISFENQAEINEVRIAAGHEMLITPLGAAILKGRDLNLIRQLLELGAKPVYEASSQTTFPRYDIHFRTPAIVYAIMGKNLAAASLLVEKFGPSVFENSYIPVHKSTAVPASGYRPTEFSPMHLAVITQQPEFVDFLYEQHADLNYLGCQHFSQQNGPLINGASIEFTPREFADLKLFLAQQENPVNPEKVAQAQKIALQLKKLGAQKWRWFNATARLYVDYVAASDKMKQEFRLENGKFRVY